MLSADPELKRQHDAWTASRARFNVDLKQPGSDAQSDKWQKLYYRGLAPDGAQSRDGEPTARGSGFSRSRHQRR